MSEPIKIGHTTFYDFNNGDLRRKFITTMNITHVLSEESKPPLLFDPAKLDIGVLKDQPMSLRCPYPVLTWHMPVVQEPMTLERAVEILNERKHRGYSDYSTDGINDNGLDYTDFDLIAIAKAYLEQK